MDEANRHLKLLLTSILDISSSLGRAQICSYKQHFALWKFMKYNFTMKPLHFYYTNRKPLMRDFQWYLGGGLGPILEPKPANLPSWPSCSCQLRFLPPTKNKLISSLADPAQCWHVVWTLRLYCFGAGCGRLMVLCPDDIAPCSKAIFSTRRRLHRGVSCTSSKHLLAPPRQ